MPLFSHLFASKKAKPPVLFGRRSTDKPPTEQRFRQMYERPVSFTNLLPWVEYLPNSKSFLLDDGLSVGALFELYPIGAEARPEQYMLDFRNRLQTVINTLPEETPSPWVLQLFIQDEPQLGRFMQQIIDYTHPRAKESKLTQTYLQLFREHLNDISKTGGLFVDDHVTGSPWRGKIRRIRACLYRRRQRGSTDRYRYKVLTPEEELQDVCQKFVTSLQSAGIRQKRLDGEGLHQWLLPWLNPNPAITEGDIKQLLKVASYPGDEAMPYGYDFSESLMFGMPASDEEKGVWWFDGWPHKVVTVQGLRKTPSIGLIGAERKEGDHIFALFDRVPEATIMAMTLTIQAQDEVRNHLSKILSAAVGDYPEAKLAAIDAENAMMAMAQGNKLFPAQIAFFARGENEVQLHQNINKINSLIVPNGLQTILEEDDLIPLDSYIRNLPMAYTADHDRRESRRSRLMFSTHAASLLPLYGRTVGTGHPGIAFFNRGAEPLTMDPLNMLDRKKNGHALIIGPTGAGKSATLVYLLLHLLALYRPRVFVIEVGDSFGLLGDYLASLEVSVNKVSITAKSDVSLPPFGEATQLLDQLNQRKQDWQIEDDETIMEQSLEAEENPDFDSVKQEEAGTGEDGPDDDTDENDRDLLGEMEISARVMITGGDIREDNRMTRADRLLIRNSIVAAAKQVHANRQKQVMTEDVVAAMRTLPDLTDRRKERAQEMADAMSLFCEGLAGKLFNRPGKRWPDVDVTLVDMGILAREGYEDQLTVAYMGLMNHIHALVERHQNDARPTLVITDEGHIITTNPLLSPYVIKIVKMWRKLGAWFWIATQNLQDFPDAAAKMLNMLEWWFCLVMPKDEIDQIARFKELTEEQRALLLAARKSPGQYTEGVALTSDKAWLFRNVPPALALALAMTEKDEKAQRAALMAKHQCSELEAVHRVAEKIAEKRGVQS